MTRRSGVFGAGIETIEAFKAQWPCHGLPDELATVIAYFDSRGDLVEIEAFDDQGRPLDSHDFDGEALVALVADIQETGYDARPHDGAALVAAMVEGRDY